MISFFKSKPKLADLIPAGFIDIHSHLLPGIDDGAKSIEDTSEMLLKLKSIGFEKCITTPHSFPGVWENTKEGILTTFIQTKSELPESTSEMLHITASEYMMNETFHERIQTDELLTIKDNLVLVEMSYLNPPLALLDIIFELKLKGYQPILAHPERYFFYHQNQKMYKTLKELDVLFQLNLLSVVGYYGSSVAIIADRLLKENLIDFVGSDVHHMQHVNSFQNKITIKSEKKLIEAIERNSILK